MPVPVFCREFLAVLAVLALRLVPDPGAGLRFPEHVLFCLTGLGRLGAKRKRKKKRQTQQHQNTRITNEHV